MFKIKGQRTEMGHFAALNMHYFHNILLMGSRHLSTVVHIY